ncbi:DUF6891 domain-containing protein [Fodinicola acaciae]|uniref:DUF6891 domain-containing protein n=1 Tax=Fodinicola acaciae TaxID=2681555 RepID=UPI0013D3285F|nr:hypothetical protein [Fodinicola acaciae]
MIEESLRTKVSDFVRVRVDIADGDFRDILRWTLEAYGDSAEVTELAEELAVAELRRHLTEQASWPPVTEPDRLTAAFRDLDRAGIVARENFTCCQNCGTAEIGAEAAEGSKPRGYAFYHHQDAEAAARGDGLDLAYGILHDGLRTPDPADTAAIGTEITATLRQHGLRVDWNGDAAKRIRVPLTWHRRWLGDPGPAAYNESADDRLVVTYFDRVRNNADVELLLSFADCKSLLDRLPAGEGNFATFRGRSGDIVQIYYEPRLWLDSPDPTARVSRGRYATVAEVVRMVDVLAREDRVALHELGELEVRPW